MAKYIKGKDGKMAGSIGDGKHNVPTAGITVPATSGPKELPADLVTELSNAYLAFQARKAAPFGPYERDMTVPITMDELSPTEFRVTAAHEKNMVGWANQNDDGTWTADIHATYNDEMDSDNILSGTFPTKSDAELWTLREFGLRADETHDFDRRWNSDPLAMQDEWKTAMDEAEPFWQETTENLYGYPSARMSGITRTSTVQNVDEDCYLVEVRGGDDDIALHLRSFPEFDDAYAFAKDMTLRTSWELPAED